MKLKAIALFLVAVVAVVAIWCPASFAQQTIVGAAPTALSPTGVTQGVAMTGQGGGGTLTVGVVAGPEMDIFTNNSSLGKVTNPALLAVSTDASSLSNIVFNSSSTVFGAIGITQPGGPFFANITGGNTASTVNFLGNVYATTLNVTGTGAVNFNSGSTNITATNFAGDGTISLAPNTTLIGALTTNTANTGTLALGGGSLLTGAVGGANGLRAINVVGGSNTAGVTASINGAVDAFSFSLGTNTLNVSGALTVANGGTGGVISTTLASPTLFGNIRPTGTTNLGSTLAINVTVPSTAFIPVGTQFNIVQTATGTTQSGTNGSVLNVTVENPTNPLYTFSAVPPAGTVNGLVAITTTGIPLLVPITPSNIPLPASLGLAGPAVTALLATPLTPDLTTVLAALNALSNPAAVVNAAAQLAPSMPDVAAPLVTFQGTRQFQDLWVARLDDVTCGQVSARQPGEETSTCRQNEPHSGWWVKGFGYFGNQGQQGPFAGYDSRIIGTMIGYDAPIDADTRAGVGIGYSRSELDGKVFTATTDFNTYQATAYIGHEQGPWFVDGDVSVGWDDYSETRLISFPGFSRTANGGYEGQDYTAFATGGYRFFTQGFTITPLASLQYTHTRLDGYQETGAGDIDLRVKSQDYDFLESGLGVKVAHDFSYSDVAFVPDIHFKWLHELYNPTLTETASFAVPGAPTFATPGLKTSDDTFDIGAAVTLLSCACTARTWTVEAAYDYEWRSDNYYSHQGMVRLSARF
jgi:uncharacterized protein with beta-barrel porin domain